MPDIFEIPDDFELVYTTEDFKTIPRTIPDGEYVAEVVNFTILPADMLASPPRPEDTVVFDIQIPDAIDLGNGTRMAFRPFPMYIPWRSSMVERTLPNGETVLVNNPDYDGNWRLRDMVKAVGLDKVGFVVKHERGTNQEIHITADKLRAWQRYVRGRRFKVSAVNVESRTEPGTFITYLRRPKPLEGGEDDEL